MRSSPIALADVEDNIIRLVEDLEEHTEAFEVLAVDHSKKRCSLQVFLG